MTAFQLADSAKAPWTRTTVGVSVLMGVALPVPCQTPRNGGVTRRDNGLRRGVTGVSRMREADALELGRVEQPEQPGDAVAGGADGEHGHRLPARERPDRRLAVEFEIPHLDAVPEPARERGDERHDAFRSD